MKEKLTPVRLKHIESKIKNKIKSIYNYYYSFISALVVLSNAIEQEK